MSSDEDGTSEPEQMLKQVTVTMSSLSLSTSTILHRYLHPATMDNLLEELLINIFIRLLAKQLAQMRSVSKSWNALLSHPSFVKFHFHRSIRNNNDHFLLVFPNYYEPFTQYSSQSPYLKLTTFIKHTPSNLPMRVIGSVNGLICLSEASYSNIHIWNPSLSAVSTIPPPHSMSSESNYVTSLRFGFDPKSEDYKLVKLIGLRDTPNVFGFVKEWLQVEVYSMRKRSWEFITQPFPSHIKSIYNSNYLFVDGHDGHLHWENTTGLRTERNIVAFDLGSETFSEIPLPDTILDSDHEWHHLGVLGGKLCVMSRHKDGTWEVWVMEEYGVPQSWVKRHVFTTAWRFAFGFTSRNELLLVDKDDRLGLYDPVANKTKLTRTKQITGKIVEYVDSLVWV